MLCQARGIRTIRARCPFSAPPPGTAARDSFPIQRKSAAEEKAIELYIPNKFDRPRPFLGPGLRPFPRSKPSASPGALALILSASSSPLGWHGRSRGLPFGRPYFGVREVCRDFCQGRRSASCPGGAGGAVARPWLDGRSGFHRTTRRRRHRWRRGLQGRGLANDH
jgi:hypothetical protein